jgi:predicted ATP-dependent endonuclease of OLD family
MSSIPCLKNQKQGQKQTFEGGIINPMKIEITSLRLVNFGPFDDVTIDFCDADGKPKDTILLAGANGSGKTTVLKVIFSAFKNLGFDLNSYKTNDSSADFMDFHTMNQEFGNPILDSADYIQIDMWIDNFNFSFYY